MHEHNGYTAGWNNPGYLPESEPAHFDTFDEAVRYLVDTVERFWDEDYAEDARTRSAFDERWLPVHTALHNASNTYDDGTHTFAETTGDGHLHFWITPSED